MTEFETPMMPNFIRLKMDERVRFTESKGFDKPGIPVGKLTPEEVELVIEQWCLAFRAHWERKRNEPDPPTVRTLDNGSQIR